MEHLDYSVTVGNGMELAGGRIEMRHGAQYTIRLGNGHNTPCDATIRIDGKEIGTFRIEGHGSVSLERPPESTGRFTFLRLGSEEASAAGLTDSEALGLISVKFTPGMKRPVYRSSPSAGTMRGLSLDGGTGLTGHSEQGFSNARPLELNHSEAVTIHMRLVAASGSDVRPLTGIVRETPIPSR